MARMVQFVLAYFYYFALATADSDGKSGHVLYINVVANVQGQMRRLILFFALTIIASCSKRNYAGKYTVNDNIIIDGQGIESFEIDETRAKDVIKS